MDGEKWMLQVVGGGVLKSKRNLELCQLKRTINSITCCASDIIFELLFFIYLQYTKLFDISKNVYISQKWFSVNFKTSGSVSQLGNIGDKFIDSENPMILRLK